MAIWRWRDQVWQEYASANVLDRGLQFGDGLFETLRFGADGYCPLAQHHRQRLSNGLQRLQFSDPAIEMTLSAFEQMISTAPANSGAKFIVTRGEAPRGYVIAADVSPNITLVRFEVANVDSTPESNSVHHITAGTNPIRLARQPLLAGIKHLNRLEQVLARQQFQDDWNESVLLDTESNVIEGCMSNVFLYLNDKWLTPYLDQAGIAGVVRDWLLESGLVEEAVIHQSSLVQCEAMIFCNTLSGPRSVQCFDGRSLAIRDEIQDWQEAFNRLYR
ncbi:MAG: aminodeoxychorismate lyase [Oleibacter sp.]|nr:aminodeoxychorismate lyase [Thalassolituus sp.]